MILPIVFTLLWEISSPKNEDILNILPAKQFWWPLTKNVFYLFIF